MTGQGPAHVDVSAAVRKLAGAGDQVRFATALALTRTAQDAQARITREMAEVFDRPNRFTQQAIGISSANKATLRAAVFVKDRQAVYLGIEETGGVRVPVPGSPVVVPIGIRTNAYGNIPRGAIARERAKGTTFVVKPDDGRTPHLRPGIYRRPAKRRRKGAAGALKLLVAVEDAARYEPRFRFVSRVIETVEKAFPGNFRDALARALATARR